MAPRLIAIVGPTASGKSVLALRLARAHAGEIVSCDSLQVYRGLDIGSAKPSAQERRAAPHHLIDVCDPGEAFSAADYRRLAREAIRAIAGRERLPIVVGGTGLYFRALFRGLFEGPGRDEALRGRLEALAVRHGDARLHRLLRRVDPEAAGRIRVRDRVRVVRALEVYYASGRTMSEHQRGGREPLEGFTSWVAGLAPAREPLREAVERRSRAMLEAGLLDEVRGLLALGFGEELRPLRAIGYRQAVAVLRGRLSQEAALRQMIAATLRYAKRQMTWFRREPGVMWFRDAQAAGAAAEAWLAGEQPPRRTLPNL